METEDLFLFPGALKPFSLLQHVCRIYYCRTVGAGGNCPHPQFLADQLTLSKSGGQIMPTTLLSAPPGFSDLPTALCRAPRG